MALMKAFVCQVVLFGLYKLFLEEVVEAHLVPDELTRNCIVGFVCLVCFGIQLYTDIPDEDYAEADENPKAKSDSSGERNAKKSESSQISATVGSNTTSGSTANSGIFAQFSPNIPDGIKVNGRTPDVPVSIEKTSYNQEVTTNPVLNGFSETVCEESDEDAGIEIDEFVVKKSDKMKLEQFKTVKDSEPIKSGYVAENSKYLRADQPKEVEPIKGENETEAEPLISFEVKDVKVVKSEDVMDEVNQSRTDEVLTIKPEEVTEADGESKCLIAEEVKSTPGKSGEVEPIKRDAIEPEQSSTVETESVTEPEQSSTVEAESVTEPEQSSTVEAESVTEPDQSATVEDEDVMVVKSEDATGEVSHSKTNEEAIIPKEVTEAVVVPKCLIANGKAEEVKQMRAIEDEVETTQSEEAVVESECLLANGEDNLPAPDSDKNTNKIGKSSEAQITNGIAKESLNIDSISSNITEETKSKSVKDEVETGNGQKTILFSQNPEYTNDVKESLQSPQDISNTILKSTKIENDLETDNTNNTETLALTEVSSSSEKLTVSTTRQKATVAADVCVAPITIDISFIYACH